MTNLQLYDQISSLPANLRQDVLDFVESLKAKAVASRPLKPREFGAAKGFFKMREDFDEPLDDFKEYM